VWNPIRAAVAVPTTIAGSLALTLSALPAQAAPVERSVQPRADLIVRLDVHPVTAVRPAAAAPTTYTVTQGDTVSAIARRYGLDTASLLSWNGLGWNSVIQPGRVLRLTAPASGPTAPAPTAAPASSPSPASTTYTIARGDTISKIARTFGVSVAAVLQANRLSPSSIIYPGHRLTIPSRIVPAAAQTPVAQTPVAQAPAPSPAPAPAATTWTVRPGDTVTGIANRFGVTVAAVLTANGLSPSSIIYPGQRLAIPSPTGLTSEQIANAKLIIKVGRQLGVSDRGIAIALGTAMQESSLRNLAHGDRDSVGLFQQRPSYGWGTPAQIADAERSTRVFYGGPHDPNGITTRGLLDVPGWQSLTFTQAAQAVQNSAYPNAYAQWEAPAARWLAALG
jgi:LysM repeat protein